MTMVPLCRLCPALPLAVVLIVFVIVVTVIVTVAVTAAVAVAVAIFSSLLLEIVVCAPAGAVAGRRRRRCRPRHRLLSPSPSSPLPPVFDPPTISFDCCFGGGWRSKDVYRRALRSPLLPPSSHSSPPSSPLPLMSPSPSSSSSSSSASLPCHHLNLIVVFSFPRTWWIVFFAKNPLACFCVRADKKAPPGTLTQTNQGLGVKTDAMGEEGGGQIALY